MKPFIIIQLRPEDETSNSEYQCFLEKSGLTPNQTLRIRAEQKGLPDINLDNYSGIMVGGSPFDITTPKDKKSEIQNKIESDFSKLLDEVIEKDFPFIGCCSGNGLLGNHCGGKISRKYPESVMAVDITLTSNAESDDLLKGLPKKFRGLVGHKECCEILPPNAVHLASSPTCPIQMFKIKNNIYATQFHPEADPEEFILRINTYKDYGYFPAEDAQKLIDAVKNEQIIHTQKILKNFVNMYKKE
jgi:GMP synthase (glutamine-hydrolysing)